MSTNVSEAVRSAPRLSREQEKARATFVQSLENATAEGQRDGFRSSEEVEASVRTVIADFP